MTDEHPDLTQSASITGRVIAAIPDDALDAATPSTQYRIGDLLEHVEGLALGLQATARKQAVPPEELRDGDAAQLKPGWRERLPAHLQDLARAWGEPEA